jgi:hemerythrin-like domain-containing protein
MPSERRRTTRREFVRTAAGVGAGLLVAGCGTTPAPRPPPAEPPPPPAPPPVSPAEELMRDHAVLGRLLLLYGEARRRLRRPGPAPVDVLARAPGLVRRYVEDHHQHLEERYVFPPFERAGRWVALVATLRKQHEAGRRLTDDVLTLATPAHMRGAGNRRRLADTLRVYVRMYRPHVSREDTVLLPELRRLVGAAQYAELARTFEERERALFGAAGFERTVDEVAGLERALGIHDLDRLTVREPRGA